MLKELLYSVTHKFVDWFTRPRSLATGLLKYGSWLLVGSVGTGVALSAKSQDKDKGWFFSFSTGEGAPFWLTHIAAATALLMIVVGIYLLLVEFRRERRRRLVVIELRGLHFSPDSPAVDKVVPKFRGERRHLLVDFRPQGSDARVDPGYLLERVSSMKPTLQSLVDGADMRDVQVAIGGLAAVPALFLAGMLMDDESEVHLYDWDRNVKSWRGIDGPDDSVRFLPISELPAAGVATEAVLVVEASYAVNQADVIAKFGHSMSIVRLRVESPLADRFWSAKKQADLAVQFRDAVQNLSALGVSKIHLVLAAPASLSLRLGMCYDRRLSPEVVVYQFERGMSPPYPWGLQMPTVGTQTKIV